MATVEERDALRLESFLESDRRISNSLRRRFDSGALHPKNVLQCLMACAGPDTFILCGAAFWLAAGSIGKLVATNSMARMSAAIISAAVGADAKRLATALGRTTIISVFADPAFVRHMRIFFGASLVTAACAGCRIWSSAKAEVMTVARVKRMLFSSLLEKDISTFDTEGTGDLLSRLSSDVTIIGTVLSTNVNLVWQNGFNLAGSMYSLYRLSPRLTLMYVLISAVWVYCTKKFGAYQQGLQRRVLGDDAKMSGIAEQSLSMIRLVRTSGTEWFERKKYYGVDAPRTGISLRNKMGWALYVPVVTLVQNSLTAAVFILGGRMVMAGTMSGSDFSAFMIFSEGVQAAIGGVADQVPAVMSALAAGEKVFQLMALKPTIPITDSEAARELQGGDALLAVKSVNFSYAHTERIEDIKPGELPAPVGSLGRGPDVLKGMELTIDRGEMVALVGLSGSGKTSLVSLILRFYDVESGTIELGGVDVTTMDPSFLRAKIATVPQEPALFSVSMHENIAYGMPDVTREEVEAAAKLSNAYDFIKMMPEGFDTVVGSRGITLSGGQRQRVAIARALLRKPELLILDEATSALDTVNEGAVLKAVDQIHKAGGLGILVIAHRLSTVKDATKICVVSKGEVVEEGPHSQLMQMEGNYAELVARQLASAEDMQ